MNFTSGIQNPDRGKNNRLKKKKGRKEKTLSKASGPLLSGGMCLYCLSRELQAEFSDRRGIC